MKYGFIKVAAASPALRVADCRYNAEKSAEMMKQAAAAGAHLLVLPELGLTGYTCGDLLLQPTLLAGAQDALQALLEESRAISLTTVAGLPLAVEGKLYNCAAVLHGGQLLGIVLLLNLPNYGEFYEERWFTPAPAEVKTISLLGQEVPFGSRLLFCCRELPEYNWRWSSARICGWRRPPASAMPSPGPPLSPTAPPAMKPSARRNTAVPLLPGKVPG